jgi:hypothetical protein
MSSSKNITNKTIKKSTERFGMSCEKSICEIFKDKKGIESIDEKRVNRQLMVKLAPKLKDFFKENKIKKLTYIGQGQNMSDFIDKKEITYSVKTNMKNNEKVCPQKIGQCSNNTFTLNVYNKIGNKKESDKILSNNEIKKWILDNPHHLLIEYYKNLFCCDYLIYVKETKTDFNINMYPTSDLKIENIINNKIIFTKKLENWNESNTLKIQFNDIPEDKDINTMSRKELNEYFLTIGEFQVHKHRKCIKFRFNFNNLISFMDNIGIKVE